MLEQYYDNTGTKYVRTYNDNGTIKNIYSYTSDENWNMDRFASC
jgi:hypothetical protein